jgi:hypothetical protein
MVSIGRLPAITRERERERERPRDKNTRSRAKYNQKISFYKHTTVINNEGGGIEDSGEIEDFGDFKDFEEFTGDNDDNDGANHTCGNPTQLAETFPDIRPTNPQATIPCPGVGHDIVTRQNLLRASGRLSENSCEPSGRRTPYHTSLSTHHSRSQLSILNCQLSIREANYQLSIINCQLFTCYFHQNII